MGFEVLRFDRSGGWKILFRAFRWWTIRTQATSGTACWKYCLLCWLRCRGGRKLRAMADSGQAKEHVLRLAHRILSHDTFSRVFRLLDPARMFWRIFLIGNFLIPDL